MLESENRFVRPGAASDPSGPCRDEKSSAEANDLLRRVRKIEIKTRGLSDEIFAGKYHTAFRRRGYVIPEDVRAVCHDVLRHRIGLTYEAEAENITSEEIVTEILNNVIVP